MARIRTFEPVKDLIIMNYLVRNEIIGNSKGGKKLNSRISLVCKAPSRSSCLARAGFLVI